MICPKCHAEYREGFSFCADCQVPLAAQLPEAGQGASEEEDGAAFDSAESGDPFCAFWEGEDARVCVDLCSVLEDAEIPYRVLRREGNLWRFTANSHIKVGVPFSLFGKAEAVIDEAFSGVAERGRLLKRGE